MTYYGPVVGNEVPGNTQSQAIVSTTPTDINLASCSIPVPTLCVGKVVAAYLEMTCNASNNDLAANSFAGATQGVYVSSDDGVTYPTKALGLQNRVGVDGSTKNIPVVIRSSTDIGADVVKAIDGGFPLKLQLTGATSVADSLTLNNISFLLRVFMA